MSVESKVGRVTRDVTIVISESVCSNLAAVLKNDMNLSNDQIIKIFSIVKSTIENTGINAVGQYVSVFKEAQAESDAGSSKKGKFFG